MSDPGSDARAEVERALAEALIDGAMLWLAGQPPAQRAWGMPAVEAFAKTRQLFRSALSAARGALALPDTDPRLAGYAALSDEERAQRLAALGPALGALLDQHARARVLGAAVRIQPVAYVPAPLPSRGTSARVRGASYRRDFDREDLLDRERARMAATLRDFEAARPRRRTDDDDDDEAVSGVEWCLDARDRGGLMLAVGPFPAHPPLPPRVELAQGSRRYALSTLGLREGASRVSVTPSRDALHWCAEALEETARAWLASRPPPWLSDAEVTVFAGSTDGPGARLIARTLTRGERYRLLVPARHEGTARSAVGEAGTWEPLAEGWWSVDFTLPASGSAAQADAFASMDLAVREPAMQVRLATLASMGAVRGAGAARIARVRDDEPVSVSVLGPASATEGATRLFVLGAGTWQTHVLGPGVRWTLDLGALAPGRYVVRAAHERSTIPSGDLLIEVLRVAQPAPFGVVVGTETLFPRAWEGRTFDLGGVFRVGGVSLLGAPGDVWVHWRGVQKVFLGSLHADEGTALDLAPVAERLQTLVGSDPVGDLCVDLGVAGEIVIAHEAPADDEASRARIVPELEAARALFDEARGPLGTWRTTWFEPVCRALGYGVEVPGATERVTTAELPDALVWRLVRARRARVGAACAAELAGALVVLPGGFAWEARASEARALASAACARWGCGRAILSDGLRWTIFDVGRRRVVRVLDLAAACESGGAAWREALDLLGA